MKRLLLSALIASAIAMGCATGPPAAEGPAPRRIQATAVQYGDVQRFTGPFAMAAQAAPSDAGPWRFDASFEFPTTGFSVGPMEIIALKRLPETFQIVIPVSPPAPDAMVGQSITTIRRTVAIQGARGAKFEVYIDLPAGYVLPEEEA